MNDWFNEEKEIALQMEVIPLTKPYQRLESRLEDGFLKVENGVIGETVTLRDLLDLVFLYSRGTFQKMNGEGVVNILSLLQDLGEIVIPEEFENEMKQWSNEGDYLYGTSDHEVYQSQIHLDVLQNIFNGSIPIADYEHTVLYIQPLSNGSNELVSLNKDERKTPLAHKLFDRLGIDLSEKKVADFKDQQSDEFWREETILTSRDLRDRYFNERFERMFRDIEGKEELKRVLKAYQMAEVKDVEILASHVTSLPKAATILATGRLLGGFDGLMLYRQLYQNDPSHSPVPTDDVRLAISEVNGQYGGDTYDQVFFGTSAQEVLANSKILKTPPGENFGWAMESVILSESLMQKHIRHRETDLLEDGALLDRAEALGISIPEMIKRDHRTFQKKFFDGDLTPEEEITFYQLRRQTNMGYPPYNRSYLEKAIQSPGLEVERDNLKLFCPETLREELEQQIKQAYDAMSGFFGSTRFKQSVKYWRNEGRERFGDLLVVMNAEWQKKQKVFPTSEAFTDHIIKEQVELYDEKEYPMGWATLYHYSNKDRYQEVFGAKKK